MRYAIVNSLSMIPTRVTVYWTGAFWSSDPTAAMLLHEDIAAHLAKKLERLRSMTEPNGLIDEKKLAVLEAMELEEGVS